ncbi:cytochrome P450 [Mycena rebaudengoi]|nr:cytochrome P450 [Mycena rebaudengoi]
MHYVPPFLLSLAFRRTEAAAALRTSERLTHDFGTRVIHERLEAEHEGLEVAQNLFSTFMQLDASEKGKQLLDSDEVVAQTAVLLLGGQDTTANTLAFGLRELAKHPDVQDQLRAEIHSSLGSNSEIVYDNLPLLNAFIKETLRMYPAEPISETMALEDTILPLTYGLATTSGEHITKLPIRKGELVLMALGSYQRLESIWGPDAHEFKPTRWFEGSPNALHIGPYANLLSFYAGPRTCLGWRFAVMEMQVLTCELLSKFSFALPENDSVRPRVAVTLMPITGPGKKGSPMVITRLL